MTGEMMQFVIAQGGATAVALLALIFLERAYKDRIAQQEQMTKQVQDDRKILIEVLLDNQKIMLALNATVENMGRELARNSAHGSDR